MKKWVERGLNNPGNNYKTFPLHAIHDTLVWVVIAGIELFKGKQNHHYSIICILIKLSIGVILESKQGLKTEADIEY